MSKLSGYWLKWRGSLVKSGRIAAVVFAVLVAIKLGWIEPLNRYRGIASSKATAEDMLQITNYPDDYRELRQQYSPRVSLASYNDSDKSDPPEERTTDRKMIRSVRLNLTVPRPSESALKIQELAAALNGYLVKSYVSGSGEHESAELEIRVPADQFEAARTELRKYAKRVNSEVTEADDVTRRYVDTRASLLNLRAQEARYREILNRATTVKDVLEVTDKLGSVRREIEQTEAEFRTISLQTATCIISVSLQVENEFKMLGIQWNPTFELKFGVRSGLESLAQYVNSMLSFALHLPAILLWSFTIIAGIALGWRVTKRVLQFAFGLKTAKSTPLPTA